MKDKKNIYKIGYEAPLQLWHIWEDLFRALPFASVSKRGMEQNRWNEFDLHVNEHVSKSFSYAWNRKVVCQDLLEMAYWSIVNKTFRTAFLGDPMTEASGYSRWRIEVQRPWPPSLVGTRHSSLVKQSEHFWLVWYHFYFVRCRTGTVLHVFQFTIWFDAKTCLSKRKG